MAKPVHRHPNASTVGVRNAKGSRVVIEGHCHRRLSLRRKGLVAMFTTSHTAQARLIWNWNELIVNRIRRSAATTATRETALTYRKMWRSNRDAFPTDIKKNTSRIFCTSCWPGNQTPISAFHWYSCGRWDWKSVGKLSTQQQNVLTQLAEVRRLGVARVGVGQVFGSHL